MNSIGYSFIEPCTFEVVHLRNRYNNGKVLMLNGITNDDILYYIMNGRPKIRLEDFSFWGNIRRVR